MQSACSGPVSNNATFCGFCNCYVCGISAAQVSCMLCTRHNITGRFAASCLGCISWSSYFYRSRCQQIRDEFKLAACFPPPAYCNNWLTVSEWILSLSLSLSLSVSLSLSLSLIVQRMEVFKWCTLQCSFGVRALEACPWQERVYARRGVGLHC